MKAVLSRRILRLNLDFALAKMLGHDPAPFLRRAKNLTAAWRGLEEA